jgi:hypothetical protein
MAGKYLETYFTPDVLAAQSQYYGRSQGMSPQGALDPLGVEEVEFISRRDSFYMATVSADGWPYLQHRGGPAGFLKVLGPSLVGFADFKGNRQLLSTGNLTGNDRVSLFLMDYVHRERLKLLGHARVMDARGNAELVEQLAPSVGHVSKIERVFLIDVVSFDWNCPQHITPRFTIAELEAAGGKV